MTRARFTLLALAAFSFGALSVSGPARAECSAAATSAIELAKEGDARRSSDIDGAIAKYEEAHRLLPSSAPITRKLAVAYLKKQDWLALAKLGATCGPTDAQCTYLRGYGLYQLAIRGDAPKLADARTQMEAALAIDPRLAAAHIDLGDIALRSGDDTAALAHWTAAIRLRPDDPFPYSVLADLYLRLGYYGHAQKVIGAGLGWGESFDLHSLAGALADRRGDANAALAQYEAARRACGICGEKQAIAFFNLGAAYARVSPPKKTEAITNLQIFNKMVCKGAGAARYRDQCTQAYILANGVGASLQ